MQQSPGVIYGNSASGIPISQIGQWAFVAGPGGVSDNIGFNVDDQYGQFNPTVTASVTAQGSGTNNILGADFNADAGTANWPQETSGRSFLFVKAAQGNNPNSFLPSNIASAPSLSSAFSFGVYDYADPDEYANPATGVVNPTNSSAIIADAQSAANAFYNIAKPYLTSGHLSPALDIEDEGGHGGFNSPNDGKSGYPNWSWSEIAQWVAAWTTQLQQDTSTPLSPILYMTQGYAGNLSPQLINSFLPSSVSFRLWVADINNSPNVAPNPSIGSWPTWAIEQYNQTGPTPPGDLDAFNTGTTLVSLEIGSPSIGSQASKLVFAQQPSNAVVGGSISPSITVKVEDAKGNLIAGNTSTITLSVATGPSSVINGSLSSPVVQGVATFSGLSVPTAGTYTFEAADSNLTVAISNAFGVGAASLPYLVEGPLRLVGSFQAQQGSPTLAANGTIQIGLNPTGAESFKPLVNVQGLVSVSNSTITANGAIDSDIGSVGPLLFQGGFTIPTGQAVGSVTDANPNNSVAIAGQPMNVTTLSFVNPNGGSTSDAEIELGGQVSLPVPLDSVSLNMPVLITDQGISLALVRVPLPNVSFSLPGGLAIDATGIAVSYDEGTNQLLLQGKVELPDIFDATADFSGAGNFISIGSQGVNLSGTVSVENVSLPGVLRP